MRNLGSITEQSIAGAITTGTHGTGIRLGNLATSIVGMKMESAQEISYPDQRNGTPIYSIAARS
jgi:hypothetical protein